MTFFTDGLKEPRITPSLDDVPSTYGETISAASQLAYEDWPTKGLLSRLPAESADYKTLGDTLMPAAAPGSTAGILFPQPDEAVAAQPVPASLQPPKIDMEQARARVKAAGLEGRFSLPESEEINVGALDIMMGSAKRSAELNSVLARGPGGFTGNALTMTTSFLTYAADPLNLASAFVPVVGEARYGKMLADAGRGALARAAVRAQVGAVEGAAGAAMLEPLNWYLKTRDGQDYSMADSLTNVMLGSVAGAGLHAGGGALADVWRGRQGKPAYPFAEGEPFAPRETPSVFKDVSEQLKAAGFTDAEAAQNAGIFAARYGARAERLGMTPEEAFDLYKSEGLEIRAGNENAPAGDRSYAQNEFAPAFYSAVDRAVAGAKQEKAAGDQWLGTLKNIPGVKQEELEWLGVEDFLKGKKSVTKQELQDYISANQVEVKEVTKGDFDKEGPIFDEIAQREFGRPYNELMDFENNKVDRLVREMNPKFSQYVLPGGENYRELLLTLPAKDDVKTAPSQAPEGWGTTDGGTAGVVRTGDRGNDYRSSHFDEPNVLAHVRFNDRVIDGKKTLFLEEVQSDWHQAGKRRGYQNVDTSGWTVKKIPKTDDQLGGFEVYDGDGKIIAGMNDLKIKSEAEAIQYAAQVRQGADGAVPDAPFKTTWPELALKRMIRYAAENGYEKIAWTTGAQQAARYDLSKQVDEILYRKNEDGTYTASAITGSRGNPFGDKIPAEKLEDYVGKDVAQRIVNGEGEKKNLGGGGTSQQEVWTSLSGDGLKVGGEGMKGFYDQILPAAVNKLTKKFGGKVKESSLRLADEGDLRRKIRENDYDPDEVDLQQILADNGGRKPRWLTEEDMDAIDAGQHLEISGLKKENVHTLDITPELRQAALEKGFSLFQRGGEGEARGRITFDENKKVIELFEKRDASTFMHEAGHLWLDELSRDAAGARATQQLKDDFAKVREWLGVKEGEELSVAQHEQWARGFEQYLADGRAPSKELVSAFRQFKEWLKGIYQNLRRLGAQIPDDIRGVMDRLLASDRSIAEMVADLPPRAKEDAMRMAIANLSDGVPVGVGEMLDTASSIDPRIAESVTPERVPSVRTVGQSARDRVISDFWNGTAARKPGFDQPEEVAFSKKAEALPDPARTKLDERLAEAQKQEQLSDDIYRLFEASLPEDTRVHLSDAIRAIDEDAATREQVLKRGLNCLLLPV